MNPVRLQAEPGQVDGSWYLDHGSQDLSCLLVEPLIIPVGIEALQLSSQAVVLPQEERVHAGQLQHLTRTGVTWQGHTWHRSGNVTLGSAHRGIFRCLDICVVKKMDNKHRGREGNQGLGSTRLDRSQLC